MKLTQRILSMILALFLVIGMIPIMAAAETEETEDEQAIIDQYSLDISALKESWSGECPELGDSVQWPNPEKLSRTTETQESENNDYTYNADYIGNDYVTVGSLSSSDLLDIYKFTLSSPSEVLIVASSTSSSLLLGIMDIYDQFVAIAIFLEYSNGYYQYLVVDVNGDLPVLDKGTYYVVAMDEYENSQTYAFSILWETVQSHTHSYSNYEVTTPATCVSQGVETGTCSCGATTTRAIAIDPDNHKNIVATPEVMPTCTSTGLKGGTHCADCGEVEIYPEEVEMLPHSYQNGLCTACGSEEPGYQELVSFVGVNMTLGNALDMNFFVNQSDISGTGNYAVITKHYADGRANTQVTIPQSQWLTLGSMYYFTFSGVNAKEMGDLFEVVIYNASGKVISEVYSDCIRDYTRRMLDKESTKDNARSLYVEMLNYGAAAQVKFNYNTGNLVNSVVTGAEQAQYGIASRTYENRRMVDTGYVGTSLTLESRILLNIVFDSQYVTSGSYAQATYINHKGQAVEETVYEFESLGAYKYVSLTSMSVADRSQLITVSLHNADGEIMVIMQDTVEGYVARMSTSDPLYQAIMRFADAAHLYFHDNLGCSHSWGSWNEVIAPTYAEEGIASRVCSKCDEMELKALPKNDHTHKWSKATCTAPKTCSVCGATDGDALGHTWKAATCTAVKTCSVCKATEGEALGHDWADATCTAAKTCTRCKKTEGRSLGHSWQAATCHAPKTCSRCGNTTGSKLSHSWGSWKQVTAPTYDEEGVEGRTCSKCGDMETRSIAKLKHSSFYVEGVSADDAVTYFDEAVTYGYNVPVVKWNKRIYYYVAGNATQADKDAIAKFAAELNEIPGFPGMSKASSEGGANMVIRFCRESEFYKYVGNWAIGEGYEAVYSFNYNSYNYYTIDAVVCVDQNLSEPSRESMLKSMIYRAMGTDGETWTRKDSIAYAYVHNTDVVEISDVDWLMLKLLYHSDMKRGYTAADAADVIRKLYY